MRLLRLPRQLRRQHAPAPGARLRERFELLVQLGSGGFGTVWEGFDMLLERPVAIKEINLETRNAGSGDLALREARATARLNHPGIVALYEVVQEDDRLYLVSELVSGRTLEELIEEGLLSDRDVAVIGVALCEALAHAHAAGVVHRDVKPANVMVPREWCEQVSGWHAQPAKLMDFGIATVLGTTGQRDDLVAGSAHYMAPEQADARQVSPAADAYSLAAVLYECFTGRPPAGCRRRDRLAGRRADLPDAMTAALDGTLVEDPARRITLDDLAAELSAARPRLSEALDRPSWLRPSWLRPSWLRTAALRLRPPGSASSRTAAPTERVVWAAALAALALLLNLALDAQLGLLALAGGAALGGASPRHGPLLLVSGATGALAGTGLGGAAVLVASAALPATAALVPELARPARGAFAAWWVLVCGVLGNQALLLAIPAGLPANAALLHETTAGFDALLLLAHPAALASVALWAAAALAWPWVTGGPRRLGPVARACMWGSALAAAELAVAVLLDTELAPGALALAVGTLGASAALGVAQWHSGRVLVGPAGAAEH